MANETAIKEVCDKADELIKIIMEKCPQNPHRDQCYFKIKEMTFWAAEALNMGDQLGNPPTHD